jgi:hypothetical protein
MRLLGIPLIALGLIYVAKPDIFRRWIWLKTSIAIRLLSETGYRRYMRGLGCILIVAGVAMIVWEPFALETARLVRRVAG